MQGSATAGAGPERSERETPPARASSLGSCGGLTQTPSIAGGLNHNVLRGRGLVGSWSRWHLSGDGSSCRDLP